MENHLAQSPGHVPASPRVAGGQRVQPRSAPPLPSPLPASAQGDAGGSDSPHGGRHVPGFYLEAPASLRGLGTPASCVGAPGGVASWLRVPRPGDLLACCLPAQPPRRDGEPCSRPCALSRPEFPPPKDTHRCVLCPPSSPAAPVHTGIHRVSQGRFSATLCRCREGHQSLVHPGASLRGSRCPVLPPPLS